MMKKWISRLVLLVLLVGAVGCGGSNRRGGSDSKSKNSGSSTLCKQMASACDDLLPQSKSTLVQTCNGLKAQAGQTGCMSQFRAKINCDIEKCKAGGSGDQCAGQDKSLTSCLES